MAKSNKGPPKLTKDQLEVVTMLLADLEYALEVQGTLKSANVVSISLLAHTMRDMAMDLCDRSNVWLGEFVADCEKVSKKAPRKTVAKSRAKKRRVKA